MYVRMHVLYLFTLKTHIVFSTLLSFLIIHFLSSTSCLSFPVIHFLSPATLNPPSLSLPQFTTGQAFWSRLKEHLQWQWGRNYAPVAGKKLVCFIDDLHNSSPCGSLGELVRGHMTSGGVWEGSGGRWHSVGDVSYVCTAHCSDSYQLDVRLAKHFTVLHWEGYEYVPILISVHSSILLYTYYMYTSLINSSSHPCTGHVMITCSSCFYHMTKPY